MLQFAVLANGNKNKYNYISHNLIAQKSNYFNVIQKFTIYINCSYILFIYKIYFCK